MASIDAVLAPVGIEDVLRGVGTDTVPVSGGGTRTIHGVSAYLMDVDYDWESGVGHTYIFNSEFQATADVFLATAGGQALVVGSSTLDADTTPVADFYGLTTFYGNTLFKGAAALVMDTGTTLAAQAVTVATTLAVTGTATLGTIAGTVTATGAWTHTSTLDTTGNVVLANGSGKTIQLGATGTSVNSVVTHAYGMTNFHGYVWFGSNVLCDTGITIDFSDAASVILPTSVAPNEIEISSAGAGAGEKLRTTTFLATGASSFEDVVTFDSTLGWELGNAVVTWDSGKTRMKITGAVEITGALTVGGVQSFSIEAGGVANLWTWGSASYEQVTFNVMTATATGMTWTKKSYIDFDNTAAPVTITALTAAVAQKFYVTNHGNQTITIAAALTKGNVAIAIAAGTGKALWWDGALFYPLS